MTMKTANGLASVWIPVGASTGGGTTTAAAPLSSPILNRRAWLTGLIATATAATYYRALHIDNEAFEDGRIKLTECSD